ncbi:Protein STRUBBELIG-RECEPTOR FAMILY 3 [Glycine soja]|uniref:protein STRUBBELIG-RECEPTOR FAMILY 3 isoform X3 n=1 Tax=Glycine max TaxID=3847 RepID=UPI0003DE971D|nr:protein STRUBBELIG-RECEPTOR FAMILY 3 isoform X3 [Glycine max]XP_028187887.1 protein STRUBBELIG-RECEPTOR FAMILY 3-like isoform X3 [Glycine soja]|eukprot:XP_006594333.1 protein STRUBBELIG-RECEPTOR FAMILY 3 isoform X3 [Glycine max]
MGWSNSELNSQILILSMLIFTASFCVGDTDPLDVAAINSLYVALGSPLLEGWKATGGDPCLEQWEGVSCVFSNITALRLGGMDLSGKLGTNLDFPSIIEMDLSNNQIGGTIPFTLPPTLRNLSLSSNQLNGSIPDALSLLTQLSDLDLSGNNLSGKLPPSMGNLSSLITLNLQNNQLSGTLFVLQDLPLQDLNIENNIFSGPIPPELLSIPNFRKDGNPFNTTIIPSPPAAFPAPAAMAPSPEKSPWKMAHNPSDTIKAPIPAIAGRSFKTTKLVWIVGAGFLIFIALGVCLLMLWCFKRRQENKKYKKHNTNMYTRSLHKRTCSNSPFEATNDEEKECNNIYELNNTEWSSKLPPLQPAPPHHIPIIPGENLIINPAISTQAAERQIVTNSIKVYTVASLQQYTNSFSQENYIGEGMLGPVYRAELPDGKLLAVRKMNTTASMGQNHEQFLQLVFSISKIQHANIVKLMGYCAEYSQRLLVHEYCNNGTLHEALHTDDKLQIKLSWDDRIQVSLGAARALEYLHEHCQPPIVHRNFRSANILLNDKLEVLVSDCGLGSLLSSGSASQLLGRHLTANGYSAPEFEYGSYTLQSDVFSFGVVMLELLTGRKSFDSSRPRVEQFLMRWAIPQLHDIDALSKMVDPSLNGEYPKKSLSRFADIISSCIQNEPEFRPAMSEIVQDLLRMM